MSTITVERPFVKAEKPTAEPAKGACSRKEEFRAALDSYIRRYVAAQTNRLQEIDYTTNPIVSLGVA